jgi:nucleotide-binding universal stress UspA family protein
MMNISKILYPTDFSKYSMAALPYAIGLSKQNESEFHCLHVVDTVHEEFIRYGYVIRLVQLPEIWESEIMKSAQKQLDRFVSENVDVAQPLVKKVIMGKPFVEIIRYARDNSIDLIVIGTHGHSALTSMLLGSVAEKVVRKAPCPVLTVRDPAHRFEAP